MQKTLNASTVKLSQLKGIGPAIASKLNAIGIESAMDLLFHLPLRYQDRTRIQPIGSLQNGVSAVIEAEIRACDIVFGKRRSLLCKIQDGTGVITLRFFHFSAAQKQRLVTGQTLRCYGEVTNIN
jgi:ATP-dependent DNA helicase RecG